MIDYLFKPLQLQNFGPDSRSSIHFVYFLTLVSCCSFAVYHALFDNPIFEILSFVAAGFICLAIWQLDKTISNASGKLGFIIVVTGEIIYASYEMGFRGLILVFPMSACYLFVFNLRTAISLCFFAIPACLIASLNILEASVVTRFAVAQFLSFSFSVAFAYTLDQKQTALKKDISRDYLTGIANRRALFSWLNTEFDNHTDDSEKITVFYIDIDNFKQINDSYGHTAGDELLIKFCARILSSIRNDELVFQNSMNVNFARLAGDEFILAIFDIDNPDAAKAVGKRILKQVSDPFKIGNTEVSINLSIGVLQTPIAGLTPKSLLDQADLAMYQAKTNGKNQIRFFDAEIAEQLMEIKKIEEGLRKAINNNGFELNFMPIFTCKTKKLVGVEVLIRPNCPELMAYGPDQFIPIAEKSGSIKAIDLFVIESTFQRIAALSASHDLNEILFAINISAWELHNDKFPNQVDKLLKKYNISPQQVELEITETTLITQDDETSDILTRLKALGLRLSLDDFGTGYTAFTQLINYPVDTLKIDQSFIRNIDTREKAQNKLVDVVLTIADIYHLDVIAEGVETKEQLEYLQKLDCEYVQGYYLAKPMPWEEFLEFHRRANQTYIKAV